MTEPFVLKICPVCHEHYTRMEMCRECELTQIWQDNDTDFDKYEEPIIYECAMCGMEIVFYETVRGHKYCHSCAAIERNG